MVNEDAALLNRRVTHMTPAALFSRRLHFAPSGGIAGHALFPFERRNARAAFV
jgi:hypothetical protein